MGGRGSNPVEAWIFEEFFSVIAKIVANFRGPWLYLISIRGANEVYFITTYTKRYDVMFVMPARASSSEELVSSPYKFSKTYMKRSILKSHQTLFSSKCFSSKLVRPAQCLKTFILLYNWLSLTATPTFETKINIFITELSSFFKRGFVMN